MPGDGRIRCVRGRQGTGVAIVVDIPDPAMARFALRHANEFGWNVDAPDGVEDDLHRHLTVKNVDDVSYDEPCVVVTGGFTAQEQIGRRPASGGPPTNPPEPILADVEMRFHVEMDLEGLGNVDADVWPA